MGGHQIGSCLLSTIPRRNRPHPSNDRSSLRSRLTVIGCRLPEALRSCIARGDLHDYLDTTLMDITNTGQCASVSGSPKNTS